MGDYVRRGRQNRIKGIQFENILVFHARHQGIHVIQMPLACKRIGRTRLIQIKSPFDFTLISKGISVYIDCKSIAGPSLSYSNLTPHQVHALETVYDAGCQAGYLCYFTAHKAIVFFDAKQLCSLTHRTSLRPEEGIYLGTIEDLHLGNLFV